MDVIPPPKILIVDDLPANLKTLRALLANISAEIIEANSGIDALSAAVEHQFALILLDVNMPEMDGYEVAKMLRSVDETRQIPIIFITAAFKDEHHRLLGYQAGAVDYIEKPINDHILLAKVAIFLQLYNAQSALKINLEKLKKSQLQQAITQFAVDQSGDAVFRLDKKGQILYANAAACQSLGYQQKQLLTMKVADFDPDVPMERWPKLWEKLKKEKKRQIHSHHKHQSGKIFPVEITANYMIIKGEESIWASVRDISERVKAEKRRRTLEKAVEQSPASIIITDPNGDIEYINPKFTQITGYTSEEVVGKNPRFLNSGLTSQKEYKKLWQTIRSGSAWQGVFINRKKDGTTFRENASISPVHDEHGEIIHYIGIKEDITLKYIQEQRLKLALEASNDGIWDWDLETDYCFYSPRLKQMLDLSTEEMPPHITSWRKRIHPKDKKHVLSALDDYLLQRRDAFEVEYRIKNGKDAWLWMRIKGKITQYDIQKQPARMVGTQSDITLRKSWIKALERSNLQLQESKAKYRGLIANIPGIVYRCAVDEHWSMNFISDAIIDLTGYPATDFINNNRRSYASVIHPEDVEYVNHGVKKGLERQCQFELEYRVIHADGTTRWVRERGQGVNFKKNGEPQWLDGVIIDSTKHKNLELSLSASQARLQAILDNASAIIFLKSLQGEYLLVNQRFSELFKIPSKKIHGHKDAELFSPEIAKAFQKSDQKVKEKREPIEFEEIITQDDGAHAYLSIKFPIFNKEKQLFAIGGIATDITHLKKTEASLRQAKKEAEKANQAKSHFLAAMSHDIRTPMNAVLGMGELLAETPLNDQQRRYLRTLHQAGESLLALINDILDLSKIEANQLILEEVPFNIQSLVDSCLEIFTLK
ncbi:PAS domain S-box protein, partial [Magnetococcales bacterium HHB-1]